MDFSTTIWDALRFIADIALHVDIYLFPLVQEYGTWIYLILFCIIFCETGLVVTPFLPGDSLLFTAGTLAGAGQLYYPLLLCLVFGAAVLGDMTNYSIGRCLGTKVFEKDSRFLKRKHLLAAQAFYDRHGGKAIILARFIPIIRTFAPFVAGVAKMRKARFICFNFSGAALWAGSLISVGYFLGNLPFVQSHFSIIIYAIIFISVLPVVFEMLRGLLAKKTADKPDLE
jgi:membrane-associated protein